MKLSLFLSIPLAALAVAIPCSDMAEHARKEIFGLGKGKDKPVCDHKYLGGPCEIQEDCPGACECQNRYCGDPNLHPHRVTGDGEFCDHKYMGGPCEIQADCPGGCECQSGMCGDPNLGAPDILFSKEDHVHIDIKV